MKTLEKMLIVLMIVTAVFGTATMAQGQEEVELIGKVDAMSLNTITVNNLLIDVTDADINTEIELGTIVEVQAFLGDDGAITAFEVNDVDEDFELGELEIIGQMDSIDDSSLVMAGQTIDISEAELEDELSPGDFVRVHAILSDENIWVARLAEAIDDDESESELPENGELQIIGTLDELEPDTLGISGQTILIDEDTELEDTLMLGLRVEVLVHIDDEEWLALEVENAVNDDEDDNGNDSDNDNDNGNVNTNDNDNDTGNVNDNDDDDDNDNNDNDDSNDNDDDNGTDNDNDEDNDNDDNSDDDDDNSGSGSDDDDGDDNSGSGSGDNDDDDSGGGPGNDNDDKSGSASGN